MKFRARLGVIAAVPFLVAACGSSGTHPATTPPSPSTSTASTASTTPRASAQRVTITPSSGLTSPQTVQVVAAGFTPGERLVVTECASKGAATQPGDCDLQGIKTVSADSSGGVKTPLAVTKGPFGANHIICRLTQPCLISVSQATLSPTQEADAPISFS